MDRTPLQAHVEPISSNEYKVQVRNEGKVPALMIRLKAMDSATGDLILPVWYSDNYFFLMPGESEEVEVRVESSRGELVMDWDYLNK